MFLFEQEKRIEARNEASLSQKKKNFFFFRAKKGIEARLHIFLLFFSSSLITHHMRISLQSLAY
jgi:hypothetical protein